MKEWILQKSGLLTRIFWLRVCSFLLIWFNYSDKIIAQIYFSDKKKTLVCFRSTKIDYISKMLFKLKVYIEKSKTTNGNIVVLCGYVMKNNELTLDECGMHYIY